MTESLKKRGRQEQSTVENGDGDMWFYKALRGEQHACVVNMHHCHHRACWSSSCAFLYNVRLGPPPPSFKASELSRPWRKL
jgi:hypothetical protein